MTLAKGAAKLNLADFQKTFGQYLRGSNPDVNPTDGMRQTMDSQSPIVVSNRVGRLYQSLVFNNIAGFLNQCFPVCQSIISSQQWQYVCRQFFATHPCHSPYFTQINQSFVDFLTEPHKLEQLDLPAYFAELAHYEWVELLVDTHCLDPQPSLSVALHGATATLSVNPSLQNLHYRWPVHMVSADYAPTDLEDSFFLVYRDAADNVQFMQVNALTHALIDYFTLNAPIAYTTDALTLFLKNYATFLGYTEHDVLITFGLPLIEQLIEQQVLRKVESTA